MLFIQFLYAKIFFFQAEDGIRDYKVTGAQTCALPILPPHTLALFPSARACAMLVYVRSGRPVVVRVNVWPSLKWRSRTVAAAPFRLGWPAGYSGCDGVLTRGSQSTSGMVAGLPSVSARGIAVTDRQVTSVASAP